ncbi:MAG: efflux RND transporter periplasmic adaptor subunit [Cellvibrio sp.]
MKKIIGYGLVGLIVLLFIWTFIFLYGKSQEKPVIYETTTPITTTIIQKTIATGKVIPRREVEIKSQVSGVVEELFFEAGQQINKGDIIARITLAPNMLQINSAESQLEQARLNLQNAAKELQRQKSLKDRKLISESEYQKFVLNYDLLQESVSSAENNLLLMQRGATKKSERVSNLIPATVTGMILDIPFKEGAFIVETSSFGNGSTVAVMADMSDMVFEGLVDEAEVGKIKEGMELDLYIGALPNEEIKAELEYISPKGVSDQGTIKFQIRAAVTLSDNVFLRSNYSSTADIILDRRDEVLAINEANLIIENNRYFVELETAPQEFEKREIKVGLSDGINIEVIEGLSLSDKIKVLK